MERFLNLKVDPSSSVPPISKIINGVGDDTNMAFFKAANFLHSGPPLNSIYTFVAIRDLVSISPLSQKGVEAKDLLPSASYKWLYLLYSITSRKLSDDNELESAKNEYVFQQLHNFLVEADYELPGTAQFAVGILCCAARLTDFVSTTYPSFTTPELFDVLFKLLNRKEYPSPVISITEFSAPELFSFLSPLALEYLPPANLFQDIGELVHTSILRLLYRIFSYMLPPDSEKFKAAVQPLCVSGLTVDIGRYVLTQLFNGNEDDAFCYSDMIQYKNLTSEIATHSKETNKFRLSLQYQSSIHLSKALNAIITISEKHPDHWATFLKENPETVSDIVNIMSSEYDSNFIVASAVLLRLGKATFDDLQFALDLFISSGSQQLRAELSQLLLLQSESLVPYILKCFPAVCRIGSRSIIFFNFLAELIAKVSDPIPVLRSLMDSLKAEFSSIQLHPNSHIYTQLSNFIDVQASYLDSQPCSVCNNPERPPSRMKLEEFRSDSKYTHDTIFLKLKSPLLISTFSLSFAVKKRSRTPRTVKLYVSSAELNGANDLLGDLPCWRHVSDLTFARDQTNATITLPLQLFATCLRFQFTEFWEDFASDGFVLRCPQCHNEVPDRRSGICPRCHENAYHCRECRHINYNHLDGFICCECGSSSYVSLEWSLTAIPSFSHTRVNCTEDVDASLAKCNDLMEDAHKIFSSLNMLRNSIDETLSPTNMIPVAERIAKLNQLYNDKCKLNFMELTKIVQHVSAIRSSVALYLNLIDGHHNSPDSNMCYNCRATYIRRGLAFLAKAAETKAIESLDAPSLLISFIDSTAFTADAVGSLLMFCKIRPDLTQRVVTLFKGSLPHPSPHMVRLLCDIGRIDDGYKTQRFTAIANAATVSTEFIGANGSMTPTVLQPLISSVLSSSLIIRKPEIKTELTIFNAWRGKETKMVDPLEVIPFDAMQTLLVDCTSQSVRESIAQLLKDAAKISQNHFNTVSKFILKLLSSVESFSLNYEQAIDVLNYLLLDPVKQRSALITGLFDELVKLLGKEVDKVLKLEHTLVLDLSVGCVVFMLTRLLSVFFSNDLNSRYILLRKEPLVVQLIHIFFHIRCLIIQRSKYLNECLSLIKKCIIGLMTKEFIETNSENSPNNNNTNNNTNNNNAITSTANNNTNNTNNTNINGNINVNNINNNNNSNNTNNDNSNNRSRNNDNDSKDDDNIEDQRIRFPNIYGSEIFIKSAIDSIKYGHTSVIRELASILVPKPPVLNIPIISKKSRGQEDYMPGHMPKEPVMSRTVGSLMRHVKNKICTDLGMTSLIEDDHGMELLVDNKIISLDLPIEDVYKNVWVPTKGETPMIVVCRLQGLDGEATEPMISSFAREETEQVAPEVKFAYTAVLCEVENGFKPILDALKSDKTPIFVANAVTVLQCFAAVKKSRIELGKLGFIEALFDIMVTIVEEHALSAEKEGQTPQNNHLKLLEDIIALTNKLIVENPAADTEPGAHIDFVFRALNMPIIHENEALLSPILALVPHLASNSRELMQKVPLFFLNGLKPSEAQRKGVTTTTCAPNTANENQANNTNDASATTLTELPTESNEKDKEEKEKEGGKEKEKEEEDFNIFEKPTSLQLLNGFGEFLLTIPINESGNAIRDVIIQQPFVTDAVKYLSKLFPLSETHTSKIWVQNVDVKSLPSLLKTLAGMVSSHPKTQSLLLENSLIPLLLELATMTSTASIGELASMVIERASAEPSIVAEEFRKADEERVRKAKEKALAERKRVLEETSRTISPDYLKMLEDIKDDDDSWECCICKEGYGYLPNEQLGFYVFENRTSVCSVTSTHFVCVHSRCHSREKTNDRSGDRHSRQILSEWEAAAVRNCERPCNSIFPIPSDTLSEESYKASLARFYESASKTADFTMNIVHDLKFHLTKLGEGTCVELSKGGGSMPNTVALFPFLVYAGTVFMDSETNNNGRWTQRGSLEKKMERVINGLEDPSDALSLSLWILSLEEWKAAKLKLLRLSLQRLRKEMDDEQLFKAAKPIFVMFIIINRMQEMMKTPTSASIIIPTTTTTSATTTTSTTNTTNSTNVTNNNTPNTENGNNENNNNSGNSNSNNDNGFLVGPHKGEKWISDFMQKVAAKGLNVCNEWKEFGEEIEDEIIVLQDLRNAFVYLEFVGELIDSNNKNEEIKALKWVRDQIQ